MSISIDTLDNCFIKAGELKKTDTSLSSLLAFYRDCYISSTSLPVSCLGLSDEELDRICSPTEGTDNDNSIIVIPPGISHWPELGHHFNKIYIKPRENFHYRLFGDNYEEENEETGDNLQNQNTIKPNSKKRKNSSNSKTTKRRKKKDESEEIVEDEEEEIPDDEEDDEIVAFETSVQINNENSNGDIVKTEKVNGIIKDDKNEVDDIDKLILAYIPPIYSDVRTEEERREEDGWSPNSEITDRLSLFIDLEKNECEGELEDLFSSLSSERQNLFKYFDMKLNNVSFVII